MHSEQSSGRMSRNERQHEIELSEADYLTREVTDAKLALTNALADLKSGVADSADLRKWVQHYPWAALGAAVAAGFAAAAAVTPAPGESISDKLARRRPDGQCCSAGDPAGKPSIENSRPLLNVSDKLLSSLFDVAKLLVQTLVLTAFQRSSASEPPATVSEEPHMTSVTK